MINIRQEANSIICKVLLKNNFSDKLLNQTAKKLKNSQRDKSLLYSLVKGTIKMYFHLEYVAKNFVDPKKFSKTPLKVKILLYLGLYQLIFMDNLPDFAIVNEMVNIAKKLFGEGTSKFINAVLREYIRNKEKINFPEDDAEFLSFYYSFDARLIEKWIELWGFDNTEKMCEYFNKPSRFYFRINTYLTSRSELFSYFDKKGMRYIELEGVDNFFYAEEPSEFLHDIVFGDGLYSVQDPSAGLVSLLVAPKSGQSVLDLFAAPGGKATHIAELMHNEGEVIAVEKFPHKVKLLKQNIARLQLNSIKIIKEDAFLYGPVAPAYDNVLIDVPCSGWGNFQKKPELRWQKNQNMKELLKLQENALEKAALFVKKEGYLIYSTCTLNPMENEEQIKRFLNKHPKFRLVPAESIVDKRFTEQGFLKVLPFKHNLDGAFAAKMQKIG